MSKRPQHSSKAEAERQIMVVFGAVTHICIQWSMILTSTDHTSTASAFVLVK